MKKLISISLIVVSSTISIAQQVTFITNHYPCPGGRNGVSFYQKYNNQYIGFYYCTMGSNSISYFDSLGNLIKNIGWPSATYYKNYYNDYSFMQTYREGDGTINTFFDKNDSILWQLNTYSKEGYFYYYKPPVMKNNSLIGFGYQKMYDPYKNDTLLTQHIARKNFSGEVIWSFPCYKYLDVNEVLNNSFKFYEILSVNNRIYLIVKDKHLIAREVIEIDTNGELLSDVKLCSELNKQYFYISKCGFYTVEFETSDGKDLIYISRFTNDCKILWNKILTYDESNNHSVIVDSLGAVHILSCDYNWKEEFPTIRLQKINSLGIKVINQTFKNYYIYYYEISDFRLAQDRGYLLAFIGDLAFRVIKTDSNGYIDNPYTRYIYPNGSCEDDFDFDHNYSPFSSTNDLIINELNERTLLSIYTISGKLIFREYVSGNGLNTYKNKLPRGFYIFTLTNEAFSYSGKLVVE